MPENCQLFFVTNEDRLPKDIYVNEGTVAFCISSGREWVYQKENGWQEQPSVASQIQAISTAIKALDQRIAAIDNAHSAEVDTIMAAQPVIEEPVAKKESKFKKFFHRK